MILIQVQGHLITKVCALRQSSLKQPPPRMLLLLACVGRECCVYCVRGGVRIQPCGNCVHTRVFMGLCTDCDNGFSLWRTKTIYLCLVRKSLVVFFKKNGLDIVDASALALHGDEVCVSIFFFFFFLLCNTIHLSHRI